MHTSIRHDLIIASQQQHMMHPSLRRGHSSAPCTLQMDTNSLRQSVSAQPHDSGTPCLSVQLPTPHSSRGMALSGSMPPAGDLTRPQLRYVPPAARLGMVMSMKVKRWGVVAVRPIQ
jgi:hypothetical protein